MGPPWFCSLSSGSIPLYYFLGSSSVKYLKVSKSQFTGMSFLATSPIEGFEDSISLLLGEFLIVDCKLRPPDPLLVLPTVILLHASLRLRNLKNKIENKIESIGLKRTPMGLLLEALGQEQEAGS